MMIKFAYTILYVKDVKRSVDFYEQVFGLAKKFMDDQHQYAEMITGSTTLSFASIKLASSNLKEGFRESSLSGKPFGIELGFTTTDVEELYQASISKGATAVEPAKTKPWGQTVAYVRDPDGFLLEICTPMEG